MTVPRTELQWTYQPADFFEGLYRYGCDDYDLLLEGGKVVATLRVAQDPVGGRFEQRIHTQVNNLLLIRQVLEHRKFELEGPIVYQHADGKKHIAIRVGSAVLVTNGAHIDMILTDATGNVIRDTKTERIAEHTMLLDLLGPKAMESSTLRTMLESYSRSVSDSTNELVHLYEIRDALKKHCGSDKNARAALRITKTEWDTLGRLANDEAIEQGRHRGKHLAGRRPASQEELAQVRAIVQRWIVAFGRALGEPAS